MQVEPTLRDAALHLAVNAVMGVAYTIILVAPIAFWIITP